MKTKTMKMLAGILLVLMAFSVVTPGAFASETDIVEETKEFENHKIMYGPHGNPGMENRKTIEAMEFETEEEELEFHVERQTEFINHRIERLNEMLGNIDEIDNENITEESIKKQIAELEILLEDIKGATTLNELKEMMDQARNSTLMRKHGSMGDRSQMEEMEFETEEEEMNFLVEKHTESINGRMEMLQEALENVKNASSLEELKEVLNEYRQNNPHGHRGESRPMNPEFHEEVAAE